MSGATLRRESGTAIPIVRLGAALHRRLEAAPSWAGRVHSCFARCFNVEGHDGRLITFLGGGPLTAPFAAALAWLPGSGTIRTGAPVSWCAGRLYIRPVILDARSATSTDLSIAPVAGGTGRLADVVARLAPAAEAAPALRSPAARRAGQRLALGIRHADAGAFLAGACGLIGLGEGLTPAGDDCLVGALAVLRRFGPRLALDGEVVSVLGRAAEGTTAVAGEFIKHALVGEFSEPVLDLVTAPSSGIAARAAMRLRAMGATSGADTLVGMSLALQALEGIGSAPKGAELPAWRRRLASW